MCLKDPLGLPRSPRTEWEVSRRPPAKMSQSGPPDLRMTHVHARRSFEQPWNHESRTPFEDALFYRRPRLLPNLLRAGASFAGAHEPWKSYSYFIKVRNAGGIKAYEKAHLKRLVAMLVHKFPQLPAAVHPRIVMHWAHVGDY